ncbi:MAG: hypothetical protein P1U56_02165 [Saprospiraceae bacterium]|nr:hypothetical protein [Saprospiraceae bacterium]
MIFHFKYPRKALRKLLFLLNKPILARVPPSILFTNWIFQRLLGINRSVPISVHYTSRIKGYKNMQLGDSVKYSFAVSASANIVVSDGTKLEVGENTIFAQNVCIRTSNHDLIDRTKYHKKSVKIGRNVWLAHGVVVLPGVSIGDNSTIGANSVVSRDIPPNVVAVGIPAKPIKTITVK